jgi:hypothetical protein
VYILVNESNSKVITMQESIDALLPSIKTAVEQGIVVVVYKEEDE